MSLRKRIERLESRIKPEGDFALFDFDGKEVNAIIIQEPQPDSDGIALLPDGSQMAVELQPSHTIYH